MNNILLVLEIIVSVILILLVLIQAGDAGLSGVWTGGGETYHSKRGVEKIVFVSTIISAVLFGVLAIAILVTSTHNVNPEDMIDLTAETGNAPLELNATDSGTFTDQLDSTSSTSAPSNLVLE